jgi:sulfur-carrier protein
VNASNPQVSDGAGGAGPASGSTDDAAAGPRGTLRYWAAAREAAGTAQEPYCADTLAGALRAAVEAHGGAAGPLERVLAMCAFVVDGQPVGRRDHRAVALTPGGTVEVLPPFAGGAA